MRTFPTEKAAFNFLREIRWQHGIVCQRCGLADQNYVHQNKANGCRKYRCKACNHIFSDTSGTIFHRSKISLQLWSFALHEFSQNKKITSVELAKRLEIRQQKAWKILAGLKKCPPEILNLFSEETTSDVPPEKVKLSAENLQRKDVFASAPDEMNSNPEASETDKQAEVELVERKDVAEPASTPKQAVEIEKNQQ
ncbi:transposase [Candidatus Gracilibacteria bacterium]|nr:transposase [Candidatus Gracilibacteria bacterium]